MAGTKNDLELNTRKCKQGFDGLNFEYKIDNPQYLFKVLPPPRALLNKNENVIARISCTNEKIELYVNPVHYISPDNIYPFNIGYSKELEGLLGEIIWFIQKYLDDNLRWMDKNEIIGNLMLKQMECNITLPCVGKAKTSDVIAFMDLAVHETMLWRISNSETDYRKRNNSCSFNKDHAYKVKIYDKTEEQRVHEGKVIDNNMLRIEIVFIQRKINAMYGARKSICDILTVSGLEIACKEYKKVFIENIRNAKLIPCLNFCKGQLLDSLINSEDESPIQLTVLKNKELIVDIEILRRALKDWYQSRNMKNNSKQVIYMYRRNNMHFPEDVIKTMKAFREALG